MMDFGRDEPQREGVRGGLEQFRWDSVKGRVLRDRECYLGQSIKIGMQGKFGRFQTNDWWQRQDGRPGDADIEQDRLRQLEKRMQEEALGLKPKSALLNPSAALAALDAGYKETEEAPSLKRRLSQDSDEYSGAQQEDMSDDRRRRVPNSGNERHQRRVSSPRRRVSGLTSSPTPLKSSPYLRSSLCSRNKLPSRSVSRSSSLSHGSKTPLSGREVRRSHRGLIEPDEKSVSLRRNGEQGAFERRGHLTGDRRSHIVRRKKVRTEVDRDAPQRKRLRQGHSSFSDSRTSSPRHLPRSSRKRSSSNSSSSRRLLDPRHHEQYRSSLHSRMLESHHKCFRSPVGDRQPSHPRKRPYGISSRSSTPPQRRPCRSALPPPQPYRRSSPSTNAYRSPQCNDRKRSPKQHHPGDFRDG
eukprot:Blabericola_migrator_1__6471@NODE_3264_length_1897_cov_137_186885_g2043_i0_p1_GENE_NODE_3264_length_1897_cov_137_186885_g2043_i0NODE_3264_length_1897_cov_137_186885_g2043_i0_p1_ORF_typecomplete_len412_score21_02MMtag/PF10159_9/8_2e13_NODE_3264_length_1897_cov_137_186885_g2043_i01361371